MEITKEIELTQLFQGASIKALTHCLEEQKLNKDISWPIDPFSTMVPPMELLRVIMGLPKEPPRSHRSDIVIVDVPVPLPREIAYYPTGDFVLYLDRMPTDHELIMKIVHEAASLCHTGLPIFKP